MTGLGLPKSFAMLHIAARAALNGQRVVFFDPKGGSERGPHPFNMSKTMLGSPVLFDHTEMEFAKPLSPSQLQGLIDFYSSQPFQPETPDPTQPVVVIARLSDAAQIPARNPQAATPTGGSS